MRSTLRDRWAGYLSVIVLIGLVGGLGLGSLAAGAPDTVVLLGLPGRNQPV